MLAIMGWAGNRLVAVAVTAALCAGCGATETAPTNTSSANASPSSSTVTAAPTPSAAPYCNVGTPGPPTIQSAFSDHLPHYFLVKEICASDVGPGLAGKDAVAGLSDLVGQPRWQTPIRHPISSF